jgi:capsular exopolysaccharide synthesis family protein
MANEISRIQSELIEAEAKLDVAEKIVKETAEGNIQQPQADGQLLAKIQEEFRKDPDVVQLYNEIAETQDQVEQIKGKARMATDPARKAAEKQLSKLQKEWDELWEEKYKQIRQRLTAAASPSQSLNELAKLRANVEVLKRKLNKQTEHYTQLKIEKTKGNTDTFEATFLNLEVHNLLRKEDQVREKLQQLEVDDTEEVYRVMAVDPARAPQIPTNSKRIKYMVAAPVGVLFLLLGLFSLLEIKAERVADPDSLSLCARSEVYSLPPLPTPREARRLGAPKAEVQIEQFIQRLEHLRFAVCSKPVELGKGRCVLITSAIGAEGKTTLAVHLASRCGNAGMSTLLIDADFRRTSLCKLLDVPDGRGLSDVLMDTATTDEVIIPVQGGTFYVLPAGTPVEDTSRLLQSRSVGAHITQLRQHYDLIIIDSPPVLPVPDALILGRWADGAVLAARYDMSRFSQVERARRQLHNAGIGILGTVFNGMRNSDSYYGRYSYTRTRPSPTNSTDAI